jgi:AcrR family transcriptional regulator
VVRRAPFSDNPDVGARGQRTQQRILDAALRVFGEDGYHESGVARITELAGCSRASFYQYFSSKEDVFRQLAGQVARQLGASTEVLGPLTPDADGWKALRAWVGRHADIYERYQPVFQAFPAAAESDEEFAGGSARMGARLVASMRSRLTTATLPPRQLDPVIELLMACVSQTHDDVRVLSLAVPGAYPRDRVEDALADVMHRTLFGLRAENVHPPARRRPPPLELSAVMRDALRQNDGKRELTRAGQRTLDALMTAGRDLFVARGYHRTRINDVVAAAGVSHGAFYRYFETKDQLAHVLAVRAIRTVRDAFEQVGDVSADRAALRRWLRGYNATQAGEAAMIRVWGDAAQHDAAIRADSAAALDWGRRRLIHFLAPRGFGDVDTEAVVMLALLGAFGARERGAPMIDAAAHIVERGFLGRSS